MTGMRLWLRRSSGLVALPALIVVALTVVLGRSGWHVEWDWAMSWTSATTIVLAPMVAGLTAFDVNRRVRPTFLALSATTRRGHRTILTVALTMWLYGTAAWGVATGYGAVRTALAGAGGTPSLWIFVEAPTALLTAALFGAMVAVLVPNIGAGPLAAIAAYMLPIVLMPFNLQGLLAAGGATASGLGIEPNPPVVIATLTTNLTLGLLCIGVALVRTLPRDRLRLAGVGAMAAALVVSAVTLASFDPLMNTYRPRAITTMCVGQAPEVCGPQEGAVHLRIAHRDLARAHAALETAGLGLDLRSRYELATSTTRPDPGVGLVYVDATQIAGGAMSVWDVAVAVATPTACDEYYADLPPEDLLDLQGGLAKAILPVIRGTGTAGLPAEDIRTTYAALAACDASAAAQVDFPEPEPAFP